MEVPIIIPVRLESTRMASKPLVMLDGKRLIRRVVDNALESKKASRVIVAADHPQVACKAMIPGESRLTVACQLYEDGDIRNGTERAARILKSIEAGFQYAIILQVDEPEITGADLDRMIDHLERIKWLAERPPLLTYAHNYVEEMDLRDPNYVKVTVDQKNRALYFSRAGMLGAYIHVGVYAIRERMLRRYPLYSPGPLEKAENLEQLRVLENGHRCDVIDLGRRVISINTERDVQVLREKLKQQEVKHAPVPASR